MREFSILTMLLVCAVSHASEPKNPMEESGMFRSWVLTKPKAIPKPDSTDDFYRGDSTDNDSVADFTPSHDITYLNIVATMPEMWAYKLFEKCLVTYCKLVIEEKKYKIPNDLKAQLGLYESYQLTSIQEFKANVSFSRNMNSWLPDRESRILWFVRKPFSLRWPTIDMYDDIQRLRGQYAVAADYVDYLFKTNPPELTIDVIRARALEKCKGPLNGVELLTLFALHAFGHGELQNLDTAKVEADKLAKSFGETPATLIHQIMEAESQSFFILSDDERGSALLQFDVFSDDENII